MLTAVALLIQLLPGILQSVGVIKPQIATLIAQLGATVPTLITAFASGQPVPDEAINVLKAFQAEIKILQADTTLDPGALQMANSLDGALTDALTAYETAGKIDDPSTLTDLPTDL